ncbi:MAG: class I SAM-dependent methyltransferase [Promethearchaeota archaeon]
MPLPPSEDRFHGKNHTPAISKKKEMQKRYNSETYNEIYDTRYSLLQTDKWKVLQPNFQKFRGNWLDFGCGTGLTWEIIKSSLSPASSSSKAPPAPQTSPASQSADTSSKGVFGSKPTYRYIGCDLARGMLNRFMSKIVPNPKIPKNKEKPSPSPVNLICCDGEKLPLRNAVFDSVISLTTLQNLPNPSQGISEIIRVATSTAPMGISVLQKSLHREKWEELFSTNLGESQRKIETMNKNQREYQEDWIFLISHEPET